MTERVLAALIAIVPGLAAWLLGRRLTAADSRLAELYRERRKRLAQITVAVIMLLAVFFTAHAFWAIPLALGARGLGWFPARRNTFGDRWGPTAYAVHSLRVIAADNGFWILLYVTPIVVVWYPPYGTALWPVFGMMLILWIWWSTPITLALLRARRVDRPELLAAFSVVSANARGPQPSVWHAGSGGGHWTRAMSLPDPHRPAVLFSDSMLQQLDVSELTAVYAHEVAHLEHAGARHVGRYRLWTGTLAAGALLLPLVPIDRWTVVIGWSLLLSGVVVWMVRRRAEADRRRETQCDAQALRLGASAQALERALVKIHGAALIPKRWPAARARLASHPSLSERVADIRSAATTHEGVRGG
jgi:Zn-dependent protease with chaperone function